MKIFGSTTLVKILCVQYWWLRYGWWAGRGAERVDRDCGWSGDGPPGSDPHSSRGNWLDTHSHSNRQGGQPDICCSLRWAIYILFGIVESVVSCIMMVRFTAIDVGMDSTVPIPGTV
jgi:hypothetical protein